LLLQIYYRLHLHNRYETETTLAILGLGLGGFVGGHLLARGLHPGVRLIAAITLVALIVAFTTEANNWQLGSLRMFYLVAFGGLAGTGTALAVNLAFIAHRARIDRSAG
jgi:hypothetical protein